MKVPKLTSLYACELYQTPIGPRVLVWRFPKHQSADDTQFAWLERYLGKPALQTPPLLDVVEARSIADALAQFATRYPQAAGVKIMRRRRRAKG